VTTPTASQTSQKPVLVVDYGAQYAQLIARRVREANVYSEVVPHTYTTEQLLAKNPAAIILSGGPSSVYADGAPGVGADLFEAGVPVFGICYGFQAMANALGGKVDKTGLREYGSTQTTIIGEGRSVLEGMPQHQNTWMSHGDSVHEAPDGFEVLATTAGAEVAAFANEEKGLFGVQWHPEVKHSAYGQQVLENFLFKGARLEPNWTTGNILEEQVERIRKQIGDARVICGLSGGVDSAVAAALVQRAVGDQLTCVFVDHGLLREGEAEQVERDFVAATGVKLYVANEQERFQAALAGVSDPETKRKIIGREFIRAFEEAELAIIAEAAAHGEKIKFLVQARCTRTSSNPAAAKVPRTSRATTTWAVSRRTCSSSSWSRCAPSSKMRSARSAPSWACRRKSSAASPSRVPDSVSASSVKSPRSGWTCCARPTRLPVPSSPQPDWTTKSGRCRWSSWPMSAASVSWATAAPTATPSCSVRSPPRTP
jgi:GMP synthase (glutamine-hydrolysing)